MSDTTPRLRVGIVGLLHESNTFVEATTTIEDFRRDMLLSGKAIRVAMNDAPHEIGGFFRGLSDAGIEAVPIFLARAVPYGVIRARDFQILVDNILDGVRAAGKLDGILAAPHGATVAEGAPDADGYWLSQLRDLAGPDVPIIATLDPHANLSPQMVAATNALIAYRTNPHIDQRETGIQAAVLMARTLRHDIQPTQAAAFPRLAINIQSQETAHEPLLSNYRTADSLAAGTESHSILLGFPYADVAEMGSAAIAVTDGDARLADDIARQIGELLIANRESFEPDFVSTRDAVRKVAGSDQKPVVLLDMGDNVGGGAPGNSTELLRAAADFRTSCFACICDPDSVALAKSAGIGTHLPALDIGNSVDPLVGDFVVASLHEGNFSEKDASHGGWTEFNQGPTAILTATDGLLTLMLTTFRVPPFSLRQLTAFGVIPSNYKIIVAKGVIAPMAAYKSVAAGFVHANTAGVTCADMTRLEFQNRRRPLFPFERRGLDLPVEVVRGFRTS